MYSHVILMTAPLSEKESLHPKKFFNFFFRLKEMNSHGANQQIYIIVDHFVDLYTTLLRRGSGSNIYSALLVGAIKKRGMYMYITHIK